MHGRHVPSATHAVFKSRVFEAGEGRNSVRNIGVVKRKVSRTCEITIYVPLESVTVGQKVAGDTLDRSDRNAGGDYMRMLTRTPSH